MAAVGMQHGEAGGFGAPYVKKDEDGNEIDCTCMKRGDACETDVCVFVYVCIRMCVKEKERDMKGRMVGGWAAVYIC